MDSAKDVIERPQALARVRESFAVHPAVAIEGPRQCGKTTLARAIAAGEREVAFFDLESPADLQRLATPELTLRPLRGLVVIDEAQRLPELFPVLRVTARPPGIARAVSAHRERIPRTGPRLVGIAGRPHRHRRSHGF